uniref:Uncharacterized protein n=1 Tax=Arundo donax TaxID=35708 RepID=A0A0A9C4W2_ARUDO
MDALPAKRGRPWPVGEPKRWRWRRGPI